MSYRFKGPQVILEGIINKIVSAVLPVSPVDGQVIIDSADKKFKVWNTTLNRWITLGDAVNQVFDNTSNGFSSSNTQAAIEEARSGALGKILSFTAIRAGSASNSYLYWGDSGVTMDDSPFIVPATARIVGVTATSNSGSRNYDIRLNIANAGAANTINRSLIYQVRNNRNIVRTDFTGTDANYNVNAGDKIAVYCATQGAAPSDLVVTVYYQLRSSANVTFNENYSSGFSITIGGITITIG